MLIDVRIEGISALLIHRFGEAQEDGAPTRAIITDRKDPRAEAASHAYVAKDGSYYFSAFCIPGSMANAGANHKMKGSRKTLRFVVPSAITVLADAITILDPATDQPIPNFEVDARPVTIPATKGRIMRYRPRFNKWAARFELSLESHLLSLDMAQQLLVEAGQSIGIGDFRPEKRGPFGRFRVTLFAERKELEAA